MVARRSTYRMTKCRDMDRAIEDTSQMLLHGGITSSDWFSDRLQRKLNHNKECSQEKTNFPFSI